jgi:hypothetical protein
LPTFGRPAKQAKPDLKLVFAVLAFAVLAFAVLAFDVLAFDGIRCGPTLVIVP